MAAGYIVKDPTPVDTGNDDNGPTQDDQGSGRRTTTSGRADRARRRSPTEEPDRRWRPRKGAAPVVLPPVDLPDLPSTSVEPVDEVLTLAQATAQCLLDGISQLDVAEFTACVTDYMTPGKQAAPKADDPAAQKARPSDLASPV